ncbi:hypothetical protein ABZ776_24650 [Streptomyces sp. NPDC007076]|uniref:hypothetical protein n=2 Tax=Streptomyces TaxID=1883 RepID=UPI00340FC6FD
MTTGNRQRKRGRRLSGQEHRLSDLEREPTLLSRQFIAARGPRAGAARLIEASAWTDRRTEEFVTPLMEFNQSIERLEGLTWSRTGRAAEPPPRDRPGETRHEQGYDDAGTRER